MSHDTANNSGGGGAAIASDNSVNLVTVIKGLKKFDGRDPAGFKTWMKKFCVVVGATRKDIIPLLKKQRKPDPADTSAFETYTRANEDLYAILFLLIELPAAMNVQKHEDETGISGDGQAAFEELCNTYNRVTDEVIRAKMEQMDTTAMNPGENPDDYFNNKIILRGELEKMGEPITDRRFKDICIQGITDEYNDVKLLVFRDPTFALDQIQSTMRNIYLDAQSRKGSKGRIAGRGFAMTTAASDPHCHYCHETGHIRRHCPKLRNKNKKKERPAGATKWCSQHNTTTHSDEECYQQGAKRPEKSTAPAKAFNACAHCSHCSSSPDKPAPEEPVIDFTYEDDGCGNGFMFAVCSPNSGRNFAATETGMSLLVDTGASETMLDDRLIPRGHLRDLTHRSAPKIVEVAGEGQLQGIATGILHCTVQDNHGQQLPLRLKGLIVPGLGRNIFSPTSLLKTGLRCVVEDKTPHLTIKNAVLPLVQDPQDQGMCTLEVSFNPENTSSSMTPELELATTSPKTASHKPSLHALKAACSVAVSADTWHRRLGHINARSMDALRKDPDTGVDYHGAPSPCSICQIGKHKQCPHPKKSTRELSRPGELVVIDNMGPVEPPAKSKGGSFPYVCKVTDDFTKMKEVYLLRKKSDTTEAIHTYNIQVVAAGGYRIETIRCDKGGENTGTEFREYCKSAAIKLEYAATNTPQQIGVSERDGQTLSAMTRCLLKDGDFPPFMWGELMMTAAYLLNRSPHSALGGATPYSKMHQKSPDLSRLRTIGARAFVHHERYRKKLEDRAFEGKLCGYGLDSQTYRVFNPSTQTVVESRNVTFIESPPRSMPFQYYTDRDCYENDVLSYTSLLGNPPAGNNLDFPTQNELLRDEIQNMQQDNLAREELRLELLEDATTPTSDVASQRHSSPSTPSTPLNTSAGPNESSVSNTGESPGNDPVSAGQDAGAADTSPGPATARHGMRHLQVTRASTRGRPAEDDPVDADLVPSSLQINMNDNGRANFAAASEDPTALTFPQLAEITGQVCLPCPSDTEDFAHFMADPLVRTQAYLYATSGDAHQGMLDVSNQVIQIPGTYTEAMNSPQCEDWKGTCGNEMDNLRKYDVCLQCCASQQRAQGREDSHYEVRLQEKTGRALQSTPRRRRASSGSWSRLWQELCTRVPHRKHPHGLVHRK